MHWSVMLATRTIWPLFKVFLHRSSNHIWRFPCYLCKQPRWLHNKGEKANSGTNFRASHRCLWCFHCTWEQSQWTDSCWQPWSNMQNIKAALSQHLITAGTEEIYFAKEEMSNVINELYNQIWSPYSISSGLSNNGALLGKAFIESCSCQHM